MLDLWDRYAQQALAKAKAEHLENRMQRRRNPRSNWEEGRQTVAEINRLIQHRHGGPCDTDDGDTYLKAILPWLITKRGGFNDENGQRVIDAWVRTWVPKVDAEAIAASVAGAEERNSRKKLWWGPQALGNLLRLKLDERENLGITRFRPYGMKRCQFAAYQRKRKAEKEKSRRIAKGARPHEQSAAQLAPWTALEMSRRTYYRQKAKGMLPTQLRDSGTNSWQPGTEYLRLASGQCQIVRQTREGPARSTSASQGVGAAGPSPKGKTRAVPVGHAVALPLPSDGFSKHSDLIGDFQQIGEVLLTYAGGMMPPDLARAVRDAQRVRMMTQDALARQIGVSRSQLGNALRGRFGLSRSAAVNLMQWLAA